MQEFWVKEKILNANTINNLNVSNNLHIFSRKKSIKNSRKENVLIHFWIVCCDAGRRLLNNNNKKIQTFVREYSINMYILNFFKDSKCTVRLEIKSIHLVIENIEMHRLNKHFVIFIKQHRKMVEKE